MRNIISGDQLSHHLSSESSLAIKVSTILSITLAASVFGWAVRMDWPDSAKSLMWVSIGSLPRNFVFVISASDSPPPEENIFVHSWKVS